MLKSSIVLTLAILGLASCSPPAPISSPQDSTTDTAEGFPLNPGTYWVYKGTVKWLDGREKRESNVSWRMEVGRVERVGRYEVSILEGHPEDLRFFVPGKPRAGHIIVKDGNKYYEIQSATNPAALLSDESKIKEKLNSESLFLELPLQNGACLGRDPDYKGDENMYCWSVGAPKPAMLDGVKGIPYGRSYLAYELAYRSTPEHTFIRFVPGIGITSYIYGHHGALSEVDVQLIEYHPAR